MPSSSPKQHRFMEAIAHNKAFAKKVGVPQSVGEEFSNADKGKKFNRGGTMKESKAMEMRQAKQLRKIADEEEAEAHGMKHGGHAKHHVKKMAMGGAGGMNPKLAAMIAAGAARGGARGSRMPAAPMAAPMGAPMGAPGMKHGGLSKTHHKHLAEHHLSMAEHHMKMHEGGHMKKMAKGGMTEREDMHAEKEGRKVAKEMEYDYKHGRKMMAKGGSTGMGPRNMSEDVEAGSNKHAKFGESKLQKTGHTRGKNLGDSGKVSRIEDEKDMKSWEKEGMKRGGKVHKYAEGGHIGSKVHSRGDGIAQRGHSRTKIC